MKQECFGTLPNGERADLFTLEGDSGLRVTITNYGGRLVSIQAPDRRGVLGEVNMGFPALAGYVEKRHYAGALVGRVANRIAHGRFTLEGKEYQLWRNPKGVCLHGGEFGYSFRLWKASEENGRLRLDYFSPDGDEHFPGNLNATVWYGLSGGDLTLEYRAATDRTTIVNMTNHAFFNLSGFTRDVLDHELRIKADAYTPVDPDVQTPTGAITPVAGTPFDFNQAKSLGRDLGAVPGGYDHNYVFAPSAPGEWLAEAYDPASGRTLAMATDQPCVQLYGGNFLDGSLVGFGGVAYRKYWAFCLEAQKHPDAINHPNFASIVLKPGETYRQTTVYRFGTQ